MTRTWGHSFLLVLVRKLYSPEWPLWTVPKRKLGNHGTESCQSIKTCQTLSNLVPQSKSLTICLFVSSWTSGYSQMMKSHQYFAQMISPPKRLRLASSGSNSGMLVQERGKMNLKMKRKNGDGCRESHVNPIHLFHFQNLGTQFPWCEGKGVTSCHEDLICWFLVEHTFLMSCQINKNCTMKFFRKSTAKHPETSTKRLVRLVWFIIHQFLDDGIKAVIIQYSMYIYIWYVVFCMHAYKSDSSPLSSNLSINSLSHHSATVTYASFPSPTVIKQRQVNRS